MNIAIIPARGGSKRIPQKNIKLFHGKPIIAYAIDVAKSSKCFDKVIVSTDCQEVAEIARFYGAETPFIRSAKNSDDHASLHDVTNEVLEKIRIRSEVSDVALILPTSPLLSAKTVRTVMMSLKDASIDSALTVVEYEASPDKALMISEQGCIIRQNPLLIVKRSQEHQVYYHDAGQMYAFRALEVLSRNTLTGPNCKAVLLGRLECQDIDNPDDWLLAEVKYKMLRT